MAEKGIAKIFKHGRSQAVRLPAAFRLTGDRVRASRVKGGVLLEAMTTDVDAWFAELDSVSDRPFTPERRDKPPSDEGLLE